MREVVHPLEPARPRVQAAQVVCPRTMLQQVARPCTREVRVVALEPARQSVQQPAPQPAPQPAHPNALEARAVSPRQML